MTGIDTRKVAEAIWSTGDESTPWADLPEEIKQVYERHARNAVREVLRQQGSST